MHLHFLRCDTRRKEWICWINEIQKGVAGAMIKIKRIYDSASKQDGFRILVDRLWPRGLSKDVAAVDLWIKDIAPSDDLRKWFGHDPEKWDDFRSRYQIELDSKTDDLQVLLEKCNQDTVTLLFAAKDSDHNNAVVLKDYLMRKQRPAPSLSNSKHHRH